MCGRRTLHHWRIDHYPSDGAVAPATLAVPPRLIELPGVLTLRRLEPADAAAVTEAVNESLEHLRPWMAWAQRRATVAGQAARLAMAVESFDVGADFGWGMFEPGGELVGAIGLARRSARTHWEVGYWVHRRYTRRGLATCGAGLVVALALGPLGLERVEIRCDERNEASAAVAVRLGFSLVSVEPDRSDGAAGSGRSLVWELRAADFAGTEGARRWAAAVTTA